MERGFTYPTTDYERDFDACYLDETYESVCELFKIMFDGKTLSEIEKGENTFDTLSNLESQIAFVAKSFAPSHVNKIKDNKKVVRFLHKFNLGYYKTDRLELSEMYSHWIEFILLRFVYRRGISVYSTAYELVENGLYKRLCLNDELFPLMAASIYGQLLSKGLAPKLNYNELNEHIKGVVSRYKMAEGFMLALDFESWVSSYFKSRNLDTSNSLIDEVLTLTMTVQREERKGGKDAEYDEIVDVVDYIYKHTDDFSEENVIDYIEHYKKLKSCNLFI